MVHYVFFMIGMLGCVLPMFSETYKIGFLAVLILSTVRLMGELNVEKRKKIAMEMQHLRNVQKPASKTGVCLYIDESFSNKYQGYQTVLFILDSGKERVFYANNEEIIKKMKNQKGEKLKIYYFEEFIVDVKEVKFK